MTLVRTADLLVADLADENAALAETIASLQADVELRRELLSVALVRLHDLERQYRGLQASHYRLIDEYRALRVQTLRQDEAA